MVMVKVVTIRVVNNKTARKRARRKALKENPGWKIRGISRVEAGLVEYHVHLEKSRWKK